MYIYTHFSIFFLRRTFWFDSPWIFRFITCISLFLTLFFPVFNYVGVFILWKVFVMKCWRPCSVSLDDWDLLHKLIRTWWFTHSQWQWIRRAIAFGRRSSLVLFICLCVFFLFSSAWLTQATSQLPCYFAQIHIRRFFWLCYH